MSAARQLAFVIHVDHVEEKALERHRARPDVYAEFLRLAKSAQKSGANMGAKAIAERIRWSRRVEMGDRDFLINNSDVACWARWAARDCKSLAGYFRLRVRTAR